jgi:hypothetical protein
VVFRGEFEISRKKIVSNQLKEVEARQMIGPFKQSVNTKCYSLGKKAKFVDLVLSLASKGQTLGFEDGFNERNYTLTMKCVSNEGILYKVKSQEFFSKVR